MCLLATRHVFLHEFVVIEINWNSVVCKWSSFDYCMMPSLASVTIYKVDKCIIPSALKFQLINLNWRFLFNFFLFFLLYSMNMLNASLISVSLCAPKHLQSLHLDDISITNFHFNQYGSTILTTSFCTQLQICQVNLHSAYSVLQSRDKMLQSGSYVQKGTDQKKKKKTSQTQLNSKQNVVF